MAKKSFKSGLDNLLASAGIKKKIPATEKNAKKEESKEKTSLSEEDKHWLLIKNERLEEELHLWRTGKLSVEEFNTSLQEYGLKYISETNKIVEK